jgi:glycosyltransferase involved in cell wall biosynthesis
MPLFSVIIPAFNRADLIGQTLDSVLNQRDFPADQIEIIAVDDGSTDRTMDILADYSRRHGIRVFQQINQGPGAARNLGLQQASGQYTAYLDSDDVWFPWTARFYSDVITSHGNPAFLAGKEHKFQTGDDLSKIIPQPIRLEPFADYFASWDDWRWWGASSFVIRRDCARSVGGFAGSWGVSEDADMAMKLGVAPGFVHFAAPVTFGYRVHSQNIVRNQGRVYAGTSLLLDHEKGGHYPGGPQRRQERLQILTRHVRACSFACLKVSGHQMAWDLYLRTMSWHARLGRWKYLAGFPLQALGALLQSPADQR